MVMLSDLLITFVAGAPMGLELCTTQVMFILGYRAEARPTESCTYVHFLNARAPTFMPVGGACKHVCIRVNHK